MKCLHAILGLSLLQIAVAKEVSSSAKAAFVRRNLQANAVVKILDDPAAAVTTERHLSKLSKVRHAAKKGDDFDFEVHPHFRRRHVGLLAGHHQRKNRQDDLTQSENCDQTLLSCLPQEQCAACFRYLYGENVDWGTVTPETSCDDVLGFLAAKNYCSDMHDDVGAKDAFCKSFNACAVWDEEGEGGEGGDDDDNYDPERIDCESLTECDWPGIHKNWLGDGICHDGMVGCYNTAICGYDGGDCCEDTCKSGTYVECGHNGFVCRDTNSTKCDPRYSYDCKNAADNPDENNPNPADTKCKEEEAKYRLVMFDSFGDGWDETKITISPTSRRSDIKFNGGLKSGSKGTQYICLPKESTCIHAEVSGGEWGNEVSWEIRPMTEGARSMAGGGAPMSCDFSVGGAACDNTCTGKPNIEPNSDPEYKEFKEMYTCIEDKCTIQVGACQKDETCTICLSEEKGDFCYGNDAFLTVVDCTMCKCTERAGSEFCHTKLNPGMPVPSGNNKDNGDGRLPDGSTRVCSPGETMKGSDAVLSFANCSGFDQVSMLVTNYDQNKFGLLDQFESCSTSFSKEDNHGGHTALGCMQILVNAMNGADGYDDENKEFAKAVAALAELLYHNAGGFCECAAKASADCPLCSSFVHVKTLLFESLDACQNLDNIDCDAWSEFQTPCKNNIISQYGSVDFSDEAVCKFVHDGCGGAGPFPAFRKLDCGEEIPKPAWDFYNEYARACLKNGSDGKYQPQPTPSSNGENVPVVSPTNRPTVAPAPNGPVAPPTPRPTPKPYNPSKPYVPKEDSGSDSSSPSSGKKTHFVRDFFILLIVGGAGFYYYKRRTDAFSFVRYRNTRNYAGGESEMYSAPYSGLTMDSSGAFQPPSLPPTPSALDGTY